MASFFDVKPGDYVVRMISNVLPVTLLVHSVDESFIYAGGAPDIGWKFRRDNGAEVDEDLGWDGVTLTGSCLVEFQE